MKIARLVFVASLVAALAAPAVGTSAPALEAIPLKAAAPAWYTPELHARVMAAGPKGVTLPSSIDIQMSSLAFLGIRPGQLIIVGGAMCSSNFVFRSGANYAIGTAGHCGKVGDPVSMVFAPRVIANIGKIIKSVSADGLKGIGNDFALISINPALNGQVSPSMAHWGGPNGIYKDPGAPLIVKHSGHGLVVGTGGTPRLGAGLTYTSSRWTFIGVISPGDSGSGAISGKGGAVGNITHLFVGGGGIQTAAGTSITRILQIAGLPLATCPQLPWPLYGCP